MYSTSHYNTPYQNINIPYYISYTSCLGGRLLPQQPADRRLCFVHALGGPCPKRVDAAACIVRTPSSFPENPKPEALKQAETPPRPCIHTAKSLSPKHTNVNLTYAPSCTAHAANIAKPPSLHFTPRTVKNATTKGGFRHNLWPQFVHSTLQKL